LTNRAKTSINIFVGKILASVYLDKNYNIQRRNFNMNKAELVSAMAEKTELSKKDAEAALKAFTDVVAEELKKGEKIQLVGFGTFEVSERAARTGRNPQTGAEMTIPASKAPKFKAGKALKDMINA
jgi:DNA-binding protein HU-beta